MEIMRGKKTSFMDATAFENQIAGYKTIHIDIGTGDGRFVRQLAQNNPGRFVIGVDACRENLHDVTRRAPANALFVIANAYDLPYELEGMANYITINFPWGSLLDGLVNHHATLLENLGKITQAGTQVDVYLNGGALKEAGYMLEDGADYVQEGLAKMGFLIQTSELVSAPDLKSYPSSWAKRLAYGRDPRAVYLYGVKLK